VVSGEIAHLKTQCLAFVGQAITEVGASPIHHGHKVVTDIKNTGGGDIADRLLVVGNILAVIASTRLDVVMQWNAFNYGPLQAVGFNQCFALENLGGRPYRSRGNMMQRGDNAG